jgi:hypothetical protein
MASGFLIMMNRISVGHLFNKKDMLIARNFIQAFCRPVSRVLSVVIMASCLFVGFAIQSSAASTSSTSSTTSSSSTASCTGTIKAGVCIPSGTGLSSDSVLALLTSFMYWLLGIFGMLGIIAFVISGVQYLAATADEKMAEEAKRNMRYSAIGIIVALSAFIIITAIDQALLGSTYF